MIEAVIEEVINEMETEIDPAKATEENKEMEIDEDSNAVTWSECLKSFDIIQNYLKAKDMKSNLLEFETLVHSIRSERLNCATSQLSILKFFPTSSSSSGDK